MFLLFLVTPIDSFSTSIALYEHIPQLTSIDYFHFYTKHTLAKPFTTVSLAIKASFNENCTESHRSVYLMRADFIIKVCFFQAGQRFVDHR